MAQVLRSERMKVTVKNFSGYKDNVADPTKINSSHAKTIDELNASENLSWVYSPYLFEETVTIGSPVILSTIEPELIQNIDLSQNQNLFQQMPMKPMYAFGMTQKKEYIPFKLKPVLILSMIY
jgi:hypothetical protein